MKIRILFAILLMTITASAQKLTVDGWRLQTNAAITGTLSVSNAIIGQGNALFFQNIYSAGSGQFIGNGASVTNILHGFITPYDVGAVGDGVTDDANALKTWLFIACSSNWIAFLPPALTQKGFACSQELQITNGMYHVNIWGTGGAVFNSDGANQNFSLINFTSQGNGIHIINSSSNVRLDGIRVTNSAAYSFTTRGIWYDGNATDNDCSSIRNCSAQGFGKGLTLSSVADTTVENCSFGANGIGIEIAGGTYANPPVDNQIRIIGCQISYNFTNQFHMTNAGQYVLIQTCDISPQAGASGPAVLMERAGYLSMSEMHVEPYSGKPCIVATDNGAGVGGTILNLQNLSCSLDGTSPGPNTYSVIATNAAVTFLNVGLSDLSDGTFPVLISGNFGGTKSDRAMKARFIQSSTVFTNTIPGMLFLAGNSGTLANNALENQFTMLYNDLDPANSYINSYLMIGARLADQFGNVGIQPIDMFQYAKDTATGGGGIPSTNGFLIGSGTSKTPILTNFTAYSSGTVYTMTASFAQVVFGTTSPTVTFNNGGTYLVYAGANFTARGATYAATNTISIKLRKTTGTPADLANSTISETMPIITTVSEGLGELTAPPVLFTAAAADVVQLQATLSATPAAGNVICDAGYVVAIRLY